MDRFAGLGIGMGEEPLDPLVEQLEGRQIPARIGCRQEIELGERVIEIRLRLECVRSAESHPGALDKFAQRNASGERKRPSEDRHDSIEALSPVDADLPGVPLQQVADGRFPIR